MKALVHDSPAQRGFRDVPEPVAGPGQQLIRVAAVGICGSDMHAYLGHDERRPAPLILGHEAARVIGGGAIGLGAALSLAAQGITDVTVLEPKTVRRAYLIENCGQNAIAPDDLAAGALCRPSSAYRGCQMKTRQKRHKGECKP